MAMLALQIIYGAFVAGTHAGHIYTTWPKMNDEWIANTVPLSWQQMGVVSLVESLPTIQFVHRTVALILFVLIVYVWLKRKSSSWNLNQQQLLAVHFLLLFLVVQFLLGVFTLLYSVPVAMGVIHQMGAFALFASLVHLLNRLYANNKQQQEA